MAVSPPRHETFTRSEPVSGSLICMVICKERPSDAVAVRAVIERAFEPMAFSSGTEGSIVDRLRSQAALSLSLVALDNEVVVGHIAFSPARHDGRADSRWYALGPVAVLPERQRDGIGSALIRTGLAQLELQGAAGYMLIGNPAYYQRFGFTRAPEHTPEGEPAEFFQVRHSESTEVPPGLRFHEAFRTTD